MDLGQLLQLTIDRKASDLHIVPTYYPAIRVNGELAQQQAFPIIDIIGAQNLLMSILNPSQKENLMLNRELDFGYNYSGMRFRVNMYFTKGGIGASFRLIPDVILTPDQLGLPPVMTSFTKIRQGFVLLTGPTGEGKSTTLASLINEINLHKACHILTIEDPIEYIYPTAKSIVSQREIGQDTHSWEISLKPALREDPDVVLIGEMRDHETIAAALTIAETGHLVFSTVHTNSASQTIDRIIDVFPEHQQDQVRVQLASVLKAVVTQRLIPSIDGGRVPAVEVLINNSANAAVIREGKTHMIDNIIQTSSTEEMIFFENSLAGLYTSGKITKENALKYAIRPKEIEKLIS